MNWNASTPLMIVGMVLSCLQPIDLTSTAVVVSSVLNSETRHRGGVGVSASSFGKNSLFFPARAAGGGGGGGADDERGSEWMAGGILAAAATRAVPSGRGDIRPEEEQFCDAFLELQSVLVRGLYSPSRFTLVLVFLCMFVLVGGWVRAIDLS